MGSLFSLVAIFYAMATCVFTPFVIRATGKPLLKSMLCSLVVQGIATVGYVAIFSITSLVTYTCTHSAELILHVFLPALICSSITVIPLASYFSKKFLRLDEAKQKQEVLNGNIIVFALLVIACWLMPF